MRARLFRTDSPRISAPMLARPALRAPGLIALALLLAAGPVLAQQSPPASGTAAIRPPAKPAAKAAKTATGPKAIGKFDDWTAATNKEAGQTVCYAFTRALASAPAVSGRGDVVLTVTQRPGGPSARDAVAISAGFAYPVNAAVTVNIDAVALEFYTSQRSAFARDGHAAAQAFLRAKQAVAHSPGPKNAAVADTFGLKGFAGAYAAINKACPAGKTAS